MLTIVVTIAPEGWDEKLGKFVEPKTKTLQLEHSLVSVSKWESKWCKPFISKKGMTDEETMDYIKCMTITQNVPPEIYDYLTKQNLEDIVHYINAPMTATVIRDKGGSKNNSEIVTSELIYYWMIALQIPVKFEKWHLNRLLTLIRVCNIKNSPPKKRSTREIMNQNAALNAARKAQLNSRG